MKILNYGSINIDMVYSVDHFVRAGETISAKQVSFFPGGKGLNQSIALSHAAGNVYHAGKVGADGKWLVDLMKENGVNTDFVRMNGTTTGTAIIQVCKEGNNCIIINHGANGEISEEEIDDTLSHFGIGDMLLLQNEINSLESIVEKAYSRGMIIALNPSPIDSKISRVDFNKVTYFLLNEIEGQALTGENEPSKISSKLRKKYDNSKIVLTLGENGVIYHDAATRIEQGIYRVQAVDTTAAGDTFTGYFLAQIMQGAPVSDALKYASIASAISVSRMGAAKSIPFFEEVHNFL